MEKGIYFVDIVEVGEVVLKTMSDDNTKNVLKEESDDFRRGAIWGMAWAATNIYSKCSRYRVSNEEDD